MTKLKFLPLQFFFYEYEQSTSTVHVQYLLKFLLIPCSELSRGFCTEFQYKVFPQSVRYERCLHWKWRNLAQRCLKRDFCTEYDSALCKLDVFILQKFQNDTNSSIGRGSKDDVVALLEESVLCRLEEDLHTGDLYNGSFSDCSMGYNCSMNHDQLLVAEITVITCTDPFGSFSTFSRFF